MSEKPGFWCVNKLRETRSWKWILPGGLAAVLLTMGGAAALYYYQAPGGHGGEPEQERKEQEVAAQVHRFCGTCHAYPPPETFPRHAWSLEVERGYGFFHDSTLPLVPPFIDNVIEYYEKRAPEQLPELHFPKPHRPYPVAFDRLTFAAPSHPAQPAVSNVNLVHLYDDVHLDLLVCDMRQGLVMAMKPYEASPQLKVLAKVPNPAHAEVVDLDGDGIKDIVVANLGNFSPTDARCGSVVWLRGRPDGTFTPITLLDNVGRVADVQMADFNGDGKNDLVVAVFGLRRTGEIVYLENQTVDWDHPKFVPHVIDERHGAIHVPVVDIHGDNKPGFVALISQEHETIVAFVNDGKGNFRKDTLYTAPHPAYGSSGIQLVDLNGDGRFDILYTNGDVLDQPYLLKPYHSIQWLENQGFDADGRLLPFKHHQLQSMYGVHRAVAADLRGDGVNDIVATTFLPEEGFPQRKEKNLDAIIVLEQTAPGEFNIRHSLETGSCDHVTCVVGDLYGTGRKDLVTGTFVTGKADHSVAIWRNLGKKKPAP